MKLFPPLAVLAVLALTRVPIAAQAPTQKSPPLGIEIPGEKRAELTAALDQFQADLESLAGSGKVSSELAERLPDVEIFPIAVRRALEWNQFYDLKQLAAAATLLTEGRSRLEALSKGTAPWVQAKGQIVRGFRSRIDGSVQPYGVVVPENTPAKGARMDVWLHGRGDKLTELAFLTERMKAKGEFAPSETVVVHPYGRFCNGFKFAGETDVLEALADAKQQYNGDPLKVAIRGFSRGGAGCWHLAAHYTSKWAVANPGAGFVETAQYAKVFAPEKPVPPWWEQVLWRLYDVPGYAANLANRPVVAYSGEIDPQKQAADLMVAAAAEKGVTIEHLVGPGTAHKYHPETRLSVAAKVDAAAMQGSPIAPEQVHLTTYTLRYNRMDWIEVTGLERHWEPSSVTAKRGASGEIELTTQGVNSLELTPPQEWKGKGAWKILCDGKAILAPANPIRLSKTTGGWQIETAADKNLRKRHGLQGPIDDAFQETFLFVRPTGKALHPLVGTWAEAEMQRALSQWRLVFRGEIRVVDDKDVTPEMMRSSHLVLWGDPGSNRLLAKLLSQKEMPHQLPLLWNTKKIRFHSREYDSASHVPVLIYPNPLSPHRYIVLNSTFTFRQGSDTTNALQTPKLPDWAVVDLSTPPNELLPGAIEDAGFFDEHWLLSEPR